MNDQSLTIINGGVGFKMFTTCYNHEILVGWSDEIVYEP